MLEIYLKATLVAAVVFGLGWALKDYVIPGRTWPQLIIAGGLIAAVYLGAALYVCVEPHHREVLLGGLMRRLRGPRAATV